MKEGRGKKEEQKGKKGTKGKEEESGKTKQTKPRDGSEGKRERGKEGKGKRERERGKEGAKGTAGWEEEGVEVERAKGKRDQGLWKARNGAGRFFGAASACWDESDKESDLGGGARRGKGGWEIGGRMWLSGSGGRGGCGPGCECG